jgi:hypothetical protein
VAPETNPRAKTLVELEPTIDLVAKPEDATLFDDIRKTCRIFAPDFAEALFVSCDSTVLFRSIRKSRITPDFRKPLQ